MADTASPVKGAFPRICELVNLQDAVATPSGTTLQAIASRMGNTLDSLWFRGEQLNRWDKKWFIHPPAQPSTRESLEEQWARAISELLTGTAYDGPEIEAKLTRKWLYEQFTTDNPVIAIANPCETLATYLVLSRGYPLAAILSASKIGLDSGDNGDLPVFHDKGGKWQPQGSRDFPTAIPPKDLQPGSCYGWLKIDETEKDGKTVRTKVVGSHVVGVLRVDESGKQGQLLDTGSAQTRLAPGDVPFTAEGWEGRGSYDNAPSTSVLPEISSTNHVPYKGLGTPAPLSDGELSEGILRLKKARPFGLARLFVAVDSLGNLEKLSPTSRQKAVKEGELKEVQLNPARKKTVTVPSKLVFMSRLCRMWGTDEAANYSIMRCQWALRSLPEWSSPKSSVFAWWVFHSPVAELATALLTAPRSTRLDQVKLKDKQQNPVPMDKTKHVSHPQPLLIVRSLADKRTQWSFVRRALEPATLGVYPSWMKDLIDAAELDTVYNPHNTPIPAELNDGVAWSPPSP